jgi:F-type H+-transporting ATPase subunit a
MYTFLLSKIEVGAHYYVNLTENLHFHGETVFVSTLVVAAVSLFLIAGTNDLQKVPGNLQNLVEVVFELVKSVALTQLGPSYYSQFLPFTATIFLFVLGSNWAGALIPWKLIELPEGELAAPTNDINTTGMLAILTSLSYFLLVLKLRVLDTLQDILNPLSFSYQLTLSKILQNHYH